MSYQPAWLGDYREINAHEAIANITIWNSSNLLPQKEKTIKSKSSTKKLIVPALLALALSITPSIPAHTQAQGEVQSNCPSSVVLWAGKILDTNSPEVSTADRPQNTLGPPDIFSVGLGSADEFVKVGDFRGGFHPGLAALLGVSESTLARADIIAFEDNGFSPAPSGGFESSHWVFSDGTSTFGVDFNENTVPPTSIPGVVASGSVNGASYKAFFGITPPFPQTVISFLLFELPPTIDTTSPAFSVKVSGGFPSEGEAAPDPDAIGILACPCKKPKDK